MKIKMFLYFFLTFFFADMASAQQLYPGRKHSKSHKGWFAEGYGSAYKSKRYKRAQIHHHYNHKR